MSLNITDAMRVQVYFESGVRKPKTISDKTGVPYSTTKKHVARLKRGESLGRKP